MYWLLCGKKSDNKIYTAEYTAACIDMVNNLLLRHKAILCV